MKKMRFTIDSQGEVSVDVLGVVGSGCDSFTNPFEQILGVVARKDRKDSYYVVEDVAQVGNSIGEGK
jgi:hypothetical protein